MNLLVLFSIKMESYHNRSDSFNKNILCKTCLAMFYFILFIFFILFLFIYLFIYFFFSSPKRNIEQH